MSVGQKRSRRLQGQEPEIESESESRTKRAKKDIVPNQLLTGKDLRHLKLYKILRDDLTHHGYVYKRGLNILNEPFDPSGDCGAGGLYVTDRPECWIDIGTRIASVTLPPDAMVWTGSVNKFKVDKLILGPITCIPDHVYEAAIRSGYELRSVPARHTRKFYRLAVDRNGWALKDIPVKYRTVSLCLAALRQTSDVIECVPEKRLSAKFCIMMVKIDGYLIKCVPQQHRTLELSLIAVQTNGRALFHVADRHKTAEVCMAAVRQNGFSLCDVPDVHRTYELCLAAVEQHGMALGHVPMSVRTIPLYQQAINNTTTALCYVPECIQDQLVIVHK